MLCTPTPSIHRLQRGLPGYLILFDPHAFEPQRQLLSSKPPKLEDLSAGEESGIPSVAVKCVDIGRNTSSEGGFLDCN